MAVARYRYVTRDLKVAARLFGFSLGKQLLPDLLKSCESIQINWPGAKVGRSGRLVVVDTILMQAEEMIREYPVTSEPSEALGKFRAFYSNYAEGAAVSLEVITTAIALSRTAALSQTLESVRTASRALVEADQEIRKHVVDSAAAQIPIPRTSLVRADNARSGVLQALSRVREVIGLTSMSPEAFSIRLFTTDAHLVRLAVGEIDSYLKPIREAYLAPGELAKEFIAVDQCVKSGS